MSSKNPDWRLWLCRGIWPGIGISKRTGRNQNLCGNKTKQISRLIIEIKNKKS